MGGGWIFENLRKARTPKRMDCTCLAAVERGRGPASPLQICQRALPGAGDLRTGDIRILLIAGGDPQARARYWIWPTHAGAKYLVTRHGARCPQMSNEHALLGWVE